MTKLLTQKQINAKVDALHAAEKALSAAKGWNRQKMLEKRCNRLSLALSENRYNVETEQKIKDRLARQ